MKTLFFSIAIMATSVLSAQIPLPEKPGMTTSPGDTTWTQKITKTKAEWKKVLSPKQFEITREEGTESPYSKGNFSDNHVKGMYYCVSCGNPLFSSATKFDSGTGWPSFWKPYATKSVKELKDNSLGVERIAVECQRCDAHLGHVFNDGPKPTGLRYCMDGLALTFKKDK